MPGLIAVSGSPGAEARLRRAAAPLLRYPWERLTTATTAAGDVALGFAGERGGVAADRETGILVAFDGEFAGPVRTGADAAGELLGLYLRDGAAIDPPDGAWCAAVWDGRADTLVLLTDPCLGRPVYVGKVDGALVAAGELKALVAAGVRARIDVQAWAERLAYEHPVGQRALLADVRMLEGGTTVVIGENEEVRRRWRFRVEPAADADDGDLVDEFGQVLEQAVLARVGDGTALALSGGLDSRCIAAVLAANGFAGLAATYGVPGSADLRIGTEIATRAGLDHLPIPLPSGYIARGAAEIVWLDEGRMRCFHAHHLALRTLRERGFRSLLIGLRGDSVVRGVREPRAGPTQREFVGAAHTFLAQAVTDALHDDVLSATFAEELRGRAQAALATALADTDGRPRWVVWKELLWLENSPTTDFDDHLAARDPFADRALMEIGLRLPFSLRERGRLERAYLQRFPALADLASPKLGLAPNSAGWREALRFGAVRARSKAGGILEGLLGPARRENRAGLADYGADLRRSGSELLSILLEPRTLDRGQLRREGVKRLVDETLSGRASHTRPLGMLLTFELFQRQFVDGDAPAPAGLQAVDAA